MKMKTGTKNATYEMDMCSGSILGKILLFALPLMCSSLLQLLFNAADIIVVGRFAGDNSLAAVGSTSSLINLLTNFFMGLSVGARCAFLWRQEPEGADRNGPYGDDPQPVQRYSFNAYRSGGGKTDSDLDEYAGRCTSACDALSADLFSGNDGNDAL